MLDVLARAVVKGLAVTAVALIWSGCGSKDVNLQIDSQPPGAFIKVNGNNLGRAPQSFLPDFDSTPTVLVQGDLEGYFPETISVKESDRAARDGIITVVLRENPVWRNTTTSKATNTWMRLQVESAITEEDAWQTLIDSVTTGYDSLEMMDITSGYLRSLWKVRTWQTPGGDYSVRTQFISAISDRDPLTYKMKIVSEQSSRGSDWEPYDRVFQSDAQMVEELNNRLGLK